MTIRTSQNNDNNRGEGIEKAQLVALKTIWLPLVEILRNFRKFQCH